MKSVDTNCARHCEPSRHVGNNKGDYGIGHYCILIMYNVLAQEQIKLIHLIPFFPPDKHMYFTPSHPH